MVDDFFKAKKKIFCPFAKRLIVITFRSKSTIYVQQKMHDQASRDIS